MSWYHPNYFWYRSWYYGVIDETDTYAEGAAAFFCRKHAALHPVAITFAKYDRLYFAADDHLSGKLPTDPEFLTETELNRATCPALVTLARWGRDIFAGYCRSVVAILVRRASRPHRSSWPASASAWRCCCHYALATPYLFELWGDAGWMPYARVMETYDPWKQSLFFYFTAPWQLVAFHVFFLFCCAAFSVGWRTSWVKWVLLIGQISYDYRNPSLTYGVDKILACLLLILCLAPIGKAISLDRVRALRLAKNTTKDLEATLPRYSSPWTGACMRLMQIQMAVLFFFSAVSKLQRRRLVVGRCRLGRVHYQ